MTSSASPCSFTTMARRWPRRAPAVRAATSTTRARVAETMGFPHYVLDYENTFREAVIEEFADAYLAGATPVPCIRCNERVKFKDLLATAKDLEADCMATGHYIQRKVGAAGPELHQAADAGARPELFPVLHHGRAAGLPALSAGPSGQQGRNAGAGGEIRSAGGGQARQSGHLFRAERQLCGGDRKAAARGGGSGRDRRSGRAACWARIAA